MLVWASHQDYITSKNKISSIDQIDNNRNSRVLDSNKLSKNPKFSRQESLCYILLKSLVHCSKQLIIYIPITKDSVNMDSKVNTSFSITWRVIVSLLKVTFGPKYQENKRSNLINLLIIKSLPKLFRLWHMSHYKSQTSWHYFISDSLWCNST